MTKTFKRITAGVVAAAAMTVTSISAFAESWTLDYTQGAPSSVSTYNIKRTFGGLTPENIVDVSCHVTTGKVGLRTEGFNPEHDSTIFSASNKKHFVTLEDPDYNGVTVEFYAADYRVVADGSIFVI